MTEHDFPDVLPDAARFAEAETTIGSAADARPVIDFTPVPRLRNRRNGWTDDRQRAFIATLSRCGSVAAAARQVGMTPRSAYRLCDAPGAEPFVRAWDEALEMGVSRLRGDSLARALVGGFVPVYRRGKLVRVEHRHNDRLAIAMLGGAQYNSDVMRTKALSKREHRIDLRALDAARAERKRALAETEAAFRAEVDRLLAPIIARGNYGPPRIRSL